MNIPQPIPPLPSPLLPSPPFSSPLHRQGSFLCSSEESRCDRERWTTIDSTGLAIVIVAN
eukprot:476164-Hanusia_phi.AAC.1